MPSGIGTGAESDSVGNAGYVQVDIAKTLTIEDGRRIGSSTDDPGAGTPCHITNSNEACGKGHSTIYTDDSPGDMQSPRAVPSRKRVLLVKETVAGRSYAEMLGREGFDVEVYGTHCDL